MKFGLSDSIYPAGLNEFDCGSAYWDTLSPWKPLAAGSWTRPRKEQGSPVGAELSE